MHITISGRLGSGKSTVSKLLSKKYGFEIYSTGAIQRGIAEKLGITTLELNRQMVGDNQLDRMIDDGVASLSRTKKGETLIFDSRMAWHFAEDSFKVYVCADPDVTAFRVMNDSRGSVEKYESIADAREKLLARSFEENRRYRELYSVDNLDYANYDLIIDSTFVEAEVIADAIHSQFISFCDAPFARTRLLLSPEAVFPSLPLEKALSDSGETSFLPIGYNNFISSGHSNVIEAIRASSPFVEGVLGDRDCASELSGRASEMGEEALREYERLGGFKYPSIPNEYR